MKVLNFGSLNIDYVYEVEHFVRPSETISSLGLNVFCGGKGLNQSIALAKAGANVYHAGKIGEDGQMLRDALEQAGVKTDYVMPSNKRSGNAIIQVDSKGQNCIMLFSGANRDITEAEVDRVLTGFCAGDLLLLQNEINAIPYMMRQAKAKGMLIAFNPSPIDASLLSYPLDLVDYFILNEIEGAQLGGTDNAEQVPVELLRKYPSSKIVLTLGKNGVLYKDSQTQESHGIYEVPVVDTTAAGDTFTGYFIAATLAGDNVSEALRKASVASSLAVSRMGAAVSIPFLSEVLKANLTLK